MELRVRVVRLRPSGDDGGDEWSDPGGWTESFAEWIDEDRGLSRSAVVTRERVPPDEGAMSGGPAEWIAIAISGGSLVLQVIALFGRFRRSLPPEDRVAVRLVVEYGGRRHVIDEERGPVPPPGDEEPGRAAD
jgi:hypothetical protein